VYLMGPVLCLGSEGFGLIVVIIDSGGSYALIGHPERRGSLQKRINNAFDTSWSRKSLVHPGRAFTFQSPNFGQVVEFRTRSEQYA
jgi:hypothetical protein